MKINKTILGVGTLVVAGMLAIAADHIDAPAVQGGTADITDYYAFQAENTSNMVFVANVQGLIMPSATGAAKFDENVMVEINIDNNGDAVEDLVIQAVPRDGKMYFFGPVKPTAPGITSTVMTGSPLGNVNISAYNGTESITTTSNGSKLFAGPRDDPFFFDFGQYTEIIAGRATGFNAQGTDTFAGSNVMSIVIEVPKSTLGSATTLNTWAESKKK
ncbi:MAG: DUF4331 domain-containing protein [Spirosomaceae bacterium]|nr:DUF4331 domain-containing protein [Spirosomataceae bacterium]